MEYEQENIICPVIHMNGSSKKSLIDALEIAGSAIETAIKSMIDVAPNGRDYYITGNFKQAAMQHEDRVLRLSSVMKELESILNSVDDQG